MDDYTRAVNYWIAIIKSASSAHRRSYGGSESISDFEAEAIAEAILRDPLYGKIGTADLRA